MKIIVLVAKGNGKDKCEDAFLICDEVVSENLVSKNITVESGWITIVDGVGGNAGGYEASNYLLNFIYDNYKASADTAEGRGNNLPEMATTFSGIYYEREKIVVAHVGNTRLYSMQGNYLKQLTMDHTTYNWLKLHGNYEQAGECNKSEIISCFGGGDTSMLKMLQVKEISQEMAPAKVLMTSDGIHDYIDIDTLEEFLVDDLKDAEKLQLILNEARKNGSCDDCTIAILER